MNSTTNILKLLNFDKFQTLQDSLSKASGLAIITIDYKGNPLTKHSNCSNFCQLARENPLSANYCQKCDSRGGLEAVRINKPYFYRCHYDLIDLAVPIIVENKYIGAIMAGQIKLKNSPNLDIERIVSDSTCESLLKDVPYAQEYYDKIPYVDYSLFLSYADLLASICSYIITEAVEKIHWQNHVQSIPLHQSTPFDISMVPAENASHNPALVLTPNFLSTHSAEEIIKPIIDFVSTHPNTFLSSAEAASLCNVSASYFSKSFKKVLNINYTQYITEIKLAWAKEFLVLSNNSIDKISDKLGFTNTSYFTRTFKKYENLTPSLYRKYYQDK